MRKRVPKLVERCRIVNGEFASTSHYGFNGAFLINYHFNEFFVICSDQDGWDHVSISLKDRCPTWDEMSYFKDLFFDQEETVVQYHPPSSKYVNHCKTCLHLWRKQNHKYELPPGKMLA
jgi:hypothetical protein